jgi:hypothetical protein
VNKVLTFGDDATGQWKIGTGKLKKSVTVDCQPRGGFVTVVKMK